MVKTPRTRQGGTKNEDQAPSDAAPSSLPPAGASLPDQPKPDETVADKPEEATPPPFAPKPPPSLLDPVDEKPADLPAKPETVSALPAETKPKDEAKPVEKPVPASERPRSPDNPLPPADLSRREPPPPPPPPPEVMRSTPLPPPQPARSGIGGLLGAGLIGGIAALALVAALQAAGIWPGAGRDDTAALQTELASLRSEIAAIRSEATPDLSASVNTLQDEVTALRNEGSEVPAAVESRIAALEARSQQAPEAAPAEALDALANRVAATEALVQQNAQSGTNTTERLATIDTTIADLSGRVEALGQQPKVALAIASSALKAAAERGAPFRAELETLRALAPALSGTEPLDQFASAGVLTRGQIQERWNEAAQAILATETAAGEGASTMQQFWSGVRGLVSVRPVGDVTGTGTDAVVARMEVAVNAGDFPRALAEFDTLPETAKVAGQPFADLLHARIAVDGQVDDAIAQAMQAA